MSRLSAVAMAEAVNLAGFVFVPGKDAISPQLLWNVIVCIANDADMSPDKYSCLTASNMTVDTWSIRAVRRAIRYLTDREVICVVANLRMNGSPRVGRVVNWDATERWLSSLTEIATPRKRRRLAIRMSRQEIAQQSHKPAREEKPTTSKRSRKRKPHQPADPPRNPLLELTPESPVQTGLDWIAC